ncbi:MAG: hypothetical protein V4662_02140 [Verrucomicrobiota bacterium]
MKRFLQLCAGLTLATLAISCTSARERRIANNPQIYQKLSTSDQVLVQQGRIREGMTKEGVFLSYGRPDSVATGRQKGSSVEQWSYMGTQPVYTNNFGMGLGYGYGRGWGYRGYGAGYYGAWDPYWGMGPNVVYVPYKDASVTFRGNRVSEFLTGPQ